MDNTSKTNVKRLTEREIFYFRQRNRNKIFQSIVAHFAEEAANNGLTKRELAHRLGKDPAQITRWFSGPGNWTLDTVSDLLLAMDRELSAKTERLYLREGPEFLQFNPAPAPKTTPKVYMAASVSSGI